MNEQLEALRSALIEWVNDSVDSLIDDDYNDTPDDLARVERMKDEVNLIHAIWWYEVKNS